MMKLMTYKLVLDARKAIAKRGLQAGDRVQKVIDSEVLRKIDPYTPRREGILIHSGPLHTQLGMGQVIQSTPYARRLYYNPGYNFNEAPRRGARWFDRMKANHRDEILRTAVAEAGGRAGK